MTEIEKLADALVDLADAALAFGEIDRTAVYHPDGAMKESDTDHTVMLGWCACAIAAKCFPWLDIGLVAQFALVHDATEIYAGDTPTLRISAEGRAAKAARERAALDRLTDEFGPSLPWFPCITASYEMQGLPEARFVRALDKVMPKLVHLLDGCKGLIEQGMGRVELAGMLARQRIDIGSYAGEFVVLLDLYDALAIRVVAHPALADIPEAVA